MQVRLLGTVELIDDDGRPVPLGGPKQRALFTMLATRPNEVVSESRLLEALWADRPPRTAGKTLQSHISRLRRALADAAGTGPRIDSRPSGYVLHVMVGDLDVTRAETSIAQARRMAADGDHGGAASALADAQAAWRGRPLGEFADEPWAIAEAARLSELRLAVVEERMEEELACGRHSAVVSDLEALTAGYPLRERLWGQRMLALYRTGRQADALRVYQELRRQLGDELGIEPGPALAQLEARILRQDPTLVAPATSVAPAGTEPVVAPSVGVVTFLLTDIEGSSTMWDRDAAGMAATLERHDRLIADVVRDGRGTIVTGKREGDGTCNVFRRASDAAATALALLRALSTEEWVPGMEPRVRIALHTGEILEGDRDYEGPTFNRAARLRSLATGGQIVLSQATAELVRDQLSKDASLVELGWYPVPRQPRGELLFELRPVEAQDRLNALSAPDEPVQVPLPASLAVYDDGSFVGRRNELDRLRQLWDDARDHGCSLVFLAGEPGIGKTRLAVELARALHSEGVTVLFG
ncbi:MAG TPA: BTAD domain-containing putative transcriptional regulator, partial [Acidimicrobiales bacterium]|nr:BTAD domain-containing putative transcriptional regulator [Acidimicrobiales bacterium]